MTISITSTAPRGNNIALGDSVLAGGLNENDAQLHHFLGVAMRNLAEGGDGFGGTSATGLRGQLTDFLAEYGDDAAAGATFIVNGGLNNLDADQTEPTILGLANDLFDELEAANVGDVVVIGCTPWTTAATNVNSTTNRQRRVDLNANLETEVGVRDGANSGTWTYIEPDDLIGDGGTSPLIYADTGMTVGDGVHLTQAAVVLLAGAVAPYLDGG